MGLGITGQSIGEDIFISRHAVRENSKMLLELQGSDDPANLELDWVSRFAVEQEKPCWFTVREHSDSPVEPSWSPETTGKQHSQKFEITDSP